MKMRKILSIASSCFILGAVALCASTSMAKTQRAIGATCTLDTDDLGDAVLSGGKWRSQGPDGAMFVCPFIDTPGFPRTEIDSSRVRVYPGSSASNNKWMAKACYQPSGTNTSYCSSAVSSSGGGGQYLEPSSWAIDDTPSSGYGYLVVFSGGYDWGYLRGFEFGDW